VDGGGGADKLDGYRICIYDVVDQFDQFEIVSQGICTPNECVPSDHDDVTLDLILKRATGKCGKKYLEEVAAMCWLPPNATVTAEYSVRLGEQCIFLSPTLICSKGHSERG
jgi:hypothetical protein